ncbi:MAG: peptidylprolyl isomerase [Bacteroidetes bacterium]|nr:MAG: peptidylprolyl isomerase [Bacteroidota bacterium]
MNIAKNSVVSLGYTLKSRTGLSLEEKQIERTTRDHPFVFIYGAGMLLPDFEKNLIGKKAGDKFDFFIQAEKGYGVKNDKHVMNIPIDSFKSPDGTLDLNEIRVSNVLTMNDNQGNQLQGTILELTAVYVRMDFNHPLAGHELHFTGEVLNVRPATAEEISHGHVHGPGGHHH